LRPHSSHDPFLARDPFGAYFLPSPCNPAKLGVFDLGQQGLQASAFVGVLDLHQ
jgi:hypothetical protein